MSDHRDELDAVPDIIGTDRSEDFTAFAVSRWAGLVRLAFGLTGDRQLAEDVAQITLAKAYVAWRRVSRVEDPDAYLRRILVNASHGRFRRRRVAEHPGDPPETAVDGPAELVSERAALLDALRQLPSRQRAVVVLRYWEDLTDAQIGAALSCSPGTVRSQLSRALAKLRMSPGPANGAAVTLSSDPGIGFAFVQLPPYIGGLILNGRETLQAVAVNVCGLHYRLVGFSYPLADNYRLTTANPAPTSYVVPLPVVYPSSSASAEFAQTAGIWNNVGPTGAETASGVVADGLGSGQDWSIIVSLGAGGDCYEFISPRVLNSPQMNACGPVSTPDGPETIMALPLANLDSTNLGGANSGRDAIAYALQVSPATAELDATLSDGSAQPVTLCVIAGRTYAAIAFSSSLRLTRLTWRNAAGKAFATTTRLPLYGYIQFQP